jgi:hypothetical protein
MHIFATSTSEQFVELGKAAAAVETDATAPVAGRL